MTVSSTTNRKEYAGNGVTTSFSSSPVVFFASGDLTVYVVSSAGVVTTLTENTHYTVTGGGTPPATGSVSLAGGSSPYGAPATGATLVIVRDLDIVQETDFVQNDGSDADVSEAALDRLTIVNQQLNARLDRSFTLADSDVSGASTVIPTPEAGAVIGWNGSADALVNYDPASAVSLGTNVTFVPAETGSVSRTIQNKARDWVSVKDFGAVGDGVTNDQAAFNAAAASGAKCIFVPYGSYVVLTKISIAAGQTWLMPGVTFLTTSSTQTIFEASTVDDWALIGPFIVSGNGSTSGTAKGVYVVGCNRWRVEKYTAKTIKGYGLYVDPGTPSGALLGDQGQVADFQGSTCYIGAQFVPGTGAEYCTLTAPMISGCGTGLIVGAGNVVVHGGNIVENTIGVDVQSGSNHAHGIFNGVNINHNTTYNIRCTQVTNGHSFADCHIYGGATAGAGAIYLDRCKGIAFDGGHLDVNRFYNDSDGSSGYNFVRNMYCPGSYGDILVTDTGAGKNQLVVQGCYGAGAYTSGVAINDPFPVYVSASRSAGSTQSLTSGVIADLVFETENFDRRLAYNNSTGIFTCPTAMAGWYRLKANTVYGGTAMDATDSYVELHYNSGSGFGAVAIFLPSIFSTTILAIPVNYEIFLNAGDQLKLKASIHGTNPTFGRANYSNTLAIERIG